MYIWGYYYIYIHPQAATTLKFYKQLNYGLALFGFGCWPKHMPLSCCGCVCLCVCVCIIFALAMVRLAVLTPNLCVVYQKSVLQNSRTPWNTRSPLKARTWLRNPSVCHEVNVAIKANTETHTHTHKTSEDSVGYDMVSSQFNLGIFYSLLFFFFTLRE